MNVVPRRDVQVDGRNYAAGSLYSVDADVVERIIAAELVYGEPFTDADEVFVDESREMTEAEVEAVEAAEAAADTNTPNPEPSPEPAPI